MPLPSSPAGAIWLLWAARDNTGGSGVKDYDLEWSQNGANPDAPIGQSGWTTLLNASTETRYPFAPIQYGVTYYFRLRSRDNANNVSGWSFVNRAIPAPGDLTPTITNSTLAAGIVGQSYSDAVLVSSGDAPLAFSVVSGVLPTGLQLNAATGAITGTPSAAQTANFTIRVTDADGDFDEQAFTITVTATATPIITTGSPLTAGTVGTAYSRQLQSANFSQSPTWSLQPGSILPAGLTLSSGGLISGTPSAAGTSSFTVVAANTSTDPAQTASKTFSLTINAAGTPTITVAPSSVNSGTANQAYNQTTAFSASGGATPYTYTKQSGTLPLGMSFDPSLRKFVGTPTQTGSFPNIVIRATDANGYYGERSYTLVINSNTGLRRYLRRTSTGNYVLIEGKLRYKQY